MNTQRRVEVELAEIFLTAAVRPGGTFASDLTAAAQARLAPHAAGALDDREACRAACVALKLAHVHPT